MNHQADHPLRVALLAPFGEFSSAYSLAHVVCDQARALRRMGHEVEVWAMNTVVPGRDEIALDIAALLRPCIAPQVFVSDETHPKRTGAYADDIAREVERFRPDAVITHDCVFQCAYVDIARAIHVLQEIDNRCADTLWIHYGHSAVPSPPPTFEGCQRWRRTIPRTHLVMYPNRATRDDVAAYYGVDKDRVLSCANPHDPRTLWATSETARRIIEATDLLTRDVVQVYPFCATRLQGKGVPHLIRVFDRMKARGRSVLLVLCAASANGEKEREALSRLLDGCEHLTENDVYVTSLRDETMARGVPSSVVNELFRCSNVFVFPTQGEACPLILAEAMAAGCVLAVNAASPAVDEYAPVGAVRFHLPVFGGVTSYSATIRKTRRSEEGEILEETETTVTGEEAYRLVIDQIAELSLEALDACPSQQAKRAAFRTFSLEAVGGSLETSLRAALAAKGNS